MTLMITGILLWALAHMMPSLSPALKQKAITSMGANAYKITFALTVVGALVLIVLGWRSAVPMPVYVAPESLKLLAIVLYWPFCCLVHQCTQPVLSALSVIPN